LIINFTINAQCNGSKKPKCAIYLNSELLFDNVLHDGENEICCKPKKLMSNNKLTIKHYNKDESHTSVDAQGHILNDTLIEVIGIDINTFDIPLLFLQSLPFVPEYTTAQSGNAVIFNHNLCFGFNGKFSYEFDSDFKQTYFENVWAVEEMLNQKNTILENGEEKFACAGELVNLDFKTTLISIHDLRELIENDTE